MSQLLSGSLRDLCCNVLRPSHCLLLANPLIARNLVIALTSRRVSMPEASIKSQSAQGKEKKKNSQRISDADTNPCLKEADLSRLCLEKNLYERERCTLEYDNYNRCKKFWSTVRSKRRYAGITPYLPNKEEREKILEMRAKGIHVTSAQ